VKKEIGAIAMAARRGWMCATARNDRRMARNSLAPLAGHDAGQADPAWRIWPDIGPQMF